MTYKTKSLLSITLFVCGLLLWKPVQAVAAEQTVANLVLMVDFAEDQNNDFASGYKAVEDMYNTAGTSGVHSYIKAISDGKVEVKSFFPQDYNGSFQAITLPGSADAYAQSDDSGFISAVINEMNTLLQNGKLETIPGDQLDTWENSRQNLDGCIDNITFLVQTANNGTFYPHAAGYGGDLTLYGKKVAQYNIVPRSSLILTGSMCIGYAVVSHEFLHSLGAPDLYRKGGNNAAGEPVGIWDEMAEPLASGASYPLAYTRKDLGWLDIQTVTESGDYILQPAKASSGNRAYILKTSRSDSEFFVIEYRPGSQERFEYDSLYANEGYFIQGGLIVYRVNTSIQDNTNVRGENYIYVYRPGTAVDCEAATEESQVRPGANAVRDAAITPTGSRTSLGSTDLNAPCTADTIFYSGGSNSGIVIDNVRFNDDGTATFHVEFPLLKEEEYWQMQGTSVSGLKNASLSGSEDGSKMYLAGIKGDGQRKAYLYSFDSTSGNWTELCSTDASLGFTDVLYVDGNIYIAYFTTDAKVSVARYENGRLAPCYTSAEWASNMELIYRDGKIWLFYYGDKGIHLVDISSGSSCQTLTVPDYVASATAFYLQGKWYVAYSNSKVIGGTGDEKGRVACYENDSWKDIYEFNSASRITQIDTCIVDDKIYLTAVDGSKNIIYLTGDGSNWTEQILDGIEVTNGQQLVVKDQIPYIFFVEGSVLHVKYFKNGTWTDFGTISSDTGDFDVFCGENSLYAATSSLGGNVSVRRMKTVQGTTDPTPEVGSGNVVLALPTGYDSSAKIYIDGVEATSTAWQNDESQRLVVISSIDQLKTTAKTATAYQYNASGIPTGMYVWRLSYTGSYYNATAIPEFENLFSYHGFSVRYTGNTGVRCTFGIDTAKKAQLISSSGLEGYRIMEMGTLIMQPHFYAKYPMIYGGNKVSRGRTYWVENGKVNNKVIRRANGRDHFANVLTEVPEAHYNTACIFRPYAVMDNNGDSIVIYGPEMSRSMYTVCKQILARGDFKPGTSGYQFLKNIVDTVEKQ